MRIFGVDVHEHMNKLKSTDKLTFDIMNELIKINDRYKSHIDVLSEQCQGYKDDADNLQKLLEAKGQMNG